MKFVARVGLVIIVAMITAMWIYGLFFAPKDSINRFADRKWAVMADATCLAAQNSRAKIADFRVVNELGSMALPQRAELVDLATDTIESFVIEFRNNLPSDPKGIALVDLWLDDYEQYVADRREFADDLRKSIDLPFSETSVQGLPISEKISTFAKDNLMPSCQTPIDLSL